MNDAIRIPSLAALRVIRIAMALGVMAFAAVAWFLRGQGMMDEVPSVLQTLLMVFVLTTIGAVLAMLVIRKKRAATSDPRTVGLLTILGWALGEAVALFGILIYLLSGSPEPPLAGMLLMAASFGLFAIRADD